MGTGFSIDTPLRVAKYGISSVISLVDDVLIEQMRRFHCARTEEPYVEIEGDEDDYRARRITAYLNLLDTLVTRQVADLQSSPFEASSEITKYYEMLPEGPLKSLYSSMLANTNPASKADMQNQLRELAVPGEIDVNIMTKVDRIPYKNGKAMGPEFSDAMTALRGYANSSLCSSIIFSAGMNPKLYGYLATFDDFFPDNNGFFKKKIILKVSDYRSAMIQGKFLAKKGLWVSEYRVESGLNCGGHGFATKGLLIGPILEEFRRRKEELGSKLFPIFSAAMATEGRTELKSIPKVRITAQGGIGTADEDKFLRNHYEIDGTGWGTPFLLVPEATNVDDKHLEKLANATDGDVYHSQSSPLGVLFSTLRNSASEEKRLQCIKDGKPGSTCPKGFLKLNTEFSEQGLCTASSLYQRKKLSQIDNKQQSAEREQVLSKSCICHDLAGGATVKHGIDPEATTAVCCGPNIVGFNRPFSLEEMVQHIYGRISLLADNDRPHMFIKELKLYVDHLSDQIKQSSLNILDNTPSYLNEFKDNLLRGIDYYQKLAENFVEERRGRFLCDLQRLRNSLDSTCKPLPA